MFNHPGSKLKTLALVIFWVIFGCGILGVIISIAAVASAPRSEAVAYMIPIAIFSLLGSFVGAWLASIRLYAFGQQVEDTEEIKERLNYLVYNTPPQQPQQQFLVDNSPYSAKANPSAYDQNQNNNTY